MDWLQYLPQFGIFAPCAILGWWVIKNKDVALNNKDKIIAALQVRNDTQSDKFTAALINRAAVDTEILTFLRSLKQ